MRDMVIVKLDNIDPELVNYIESSARIRRISCARLLERVLRTVCQDQLILSVLDDDSRPQQMPLPGETKTTRFHNYHTNAPRHRNKQDN